MKTKLVVAIAIGAGCGMLGCLDAGGARLIGEEEDLASDAGDETEPEAEADALAHEDAAEEASDGLEAETEDESADASDVHGAEDFAESGDGEEEGETIEPCTPPEILSSGLYLFYCLASGERANMSLWRWAIRYGGAPIIDWAEDETCQVLDSRTLFCDLTSYLDWAAATVFFNIQMPGDPNRWACELSPTRDFTSPYGTPRVWRDGVELATGMAVLPIGRPPYEECTHGFYLTRDFP